MVQNYINMKTKTFTLFTSNEDELYTRINVVIYKNGTFKNTNKITQTQSIKKYPVNNEQRRRRYKLNKKRKEKLEKELKWFKESIDVYKKAEIGMKRKKDLDSECDIDMNAELEDAESYW